MAGFGPLMRSILYIMHIIILSDLESEGPPIG